VQAFKKAVPKRFQSIHHSKADIRAETLLHIPSTQFLCKLQKSVVFADIQTILADEKDWSTFQKLSACSQALGLAIKTLNGALKGGKKA
jgi:hypothetical protein